MKHEYYKSCGRDDCDGSCVLCTLTVCKVCGLYEGGLTTHCPGVQACHSHSSAVYEGKEDFRDGQWVNGVSPHCPTGLRDASDGIMANEIKQEANNA